MGPRYFSNSIYLFPPPLASSAVSSWITESLGSPSLLVYPVYAQLSPPSPDAPTSTVPWRTQPRPPLPNPPREPGHRVTYHTALWSSCFPAAFVSQPRHQVCGQFSSGEILLFLHCQGASKSCTRSTWKCI